MRPVLGLPIIKIEEVSNKNSSTSKVFCGSHDSELFRLIDQNGFEHFSVFIPRIFKRIQLINEKHLTF